MIDGRDVELIGEINDAEKPDFLSGAIALLVPIDWPEPFGLVMIEAMACGTPVIAFNRGSVPEIVEHGVTGLIVESEAEAVEADQPRSTAVARQRAPQLRAQVHRAADGRGLLGVVSPPGCPGASDTARGSVGWSFPGALAPASAAAPRPLERSREPRHASAFLRATHWRGGLGQTSLNVAGQIVQKPQHALEALRRSAPRRWMVCCCRARRAAPTLPGTW